jgi:hypothetical protein
MCVHNGSVLGYTGIEMQTMNTPTNYEIRVQGHLGSSAATWFPGLTIRCEANGETILTGPVADQSALHGILMRVRDLGLPLILVRRVETNLEEIDNE